ncbi:MAG: bifunctional 2-polyprenyl-6-hydroxyphenol methylase/3-demethylubiquinol 3-O-methyltransferase UbiG [Legionellales bacterium]|nr:bifunctional 2-polyprenyl-6-hydroxyphenol methylase/3-demethylubiquinol 3-O-methyltransferase UbiG [Legionellales bacterium]
MNPSSTIDPQEVAKFADHAREWWNTEGPLKTLHDINPTRLAFILSQTPLEGMQVLDVGCGGGILTEAMAIQGAIVTGLDVEPHAIAAAKARVALHQRSIDYECMPIEAYDHALFDVVTCMEMLEHVPSPEAIIKHCARLLKPNGVLIMSTIHRTIQSYMSLILAAEYLLNLLPRQTHDYAKFIKPSELSIMARSAGLETMCLKGMSYNPFTRHAAIQASVQVNYLISCRKS